MDLQKMIDSTNAEWRRGRSAYHLTLGELIKALEITNPEHIVVCDNGQAPGYPHSYRGYYSDLSFEPEEMQPTVRDFLAKCKRVLGTTLEGYKGGNFVMDARTPLWLSGWGDCSSVAIMGTERADAQKTFVLHTKLLEDE